VWGLTEGYALMVGGSDEDVAKVQPFFDALKPDGEFGFVHAGPVGAGHFAKMVHNGIEYGLMQAYAEGWELLQAADVVTDVTAVLRSWRSGTVIRSWLLDLLVNAVEQDGELSELQGYAEDSGEGRWTVQAAVDHAVPLPVITAALFARFGSRQHDSPAMKVVATLRNQFGGHAVTSSAGSEQTGADSPGADAAARPVNTTRPQDVPAVRRAPSLVMVHGERPCINWGDRRQHRRGPRATGVAGLVRSRRAPRAACRSVAA
jgi:6-phosphogluconate dehydrogenase